MKASRVSYIHLNALRRAFLDCDTDGEHHGIISKRDFLIKVADEGFQVPLEFLICFLEDIQLDPSDQSEDAKVSYERLKTIIDVYNNTPAFLK